MMSTTTHSVISVVALTLLFGCAQPSADVQSKVAEVCTDPRPMMCTMDYTPVCGLRGEVWNTYSNGCSACSDAEVSGYRPGECVADE